MLQIPRARRRTFSTSSLMHSIAQEMEVGCPSLAVLCGVFPHLNRRGKMKMSRTSDDMHNQTIEQITFDDRDRGATWLFLRYFPVSVFPTVN